MSTPAGCGPEGWPPRSSPLSPPWWACWSAAGSSTFRCWPAPQRHHGDVHTTGFLLAAAAAALVAAALVHLLLLSTPSRLPFRWMVGLVTTLAVVYPFSTPPLREGRHGTRRPGAGDCDRIPRRHGGIPVCGAGYGPRMTAPRRSRTTPVGQAPATVSRRLDAIRHVGQPSWWAPRRRRGVQGK